MPALIQLLLTHPPQLRTYPARLHGAACALLENPDTDHTAAIKPFATTPLTPHPDGTATWQLGWLPDTPPPVIPATITFGDTTCTVLDQHLTHHTYLQLATTPTPLRAVEFTITSPMYFSRNGRDHPLPDPVLITRNLITRWNHHAPAHIHITDTHTRDVTTHIHLIHLDGHTVRAKTTYTSHQTGYLGTVTLGLPRTAPPHTHHTLATLAHYATITGIGAQTTHGYGTCQLTATTPA
ncbi:CRISPR system precrRNA processing endoribonuclease RAMP protein Cas6 [Nocardia beijingensis]|uniref:CRISPR system precrRNA processing endoribonuclease RAMP protein Cas6 n=1 Tax=Nocardia beijingensis TaxID=95162 RepID=UPI00344E2FCC